MAGSVTGKKSSLEVYFGKKGLPRKSSELSKEELLLTLQKKRECNARALTIVENLLEPRISESWFLGVVHQINQSHLQDVTEERAISKLCGYPLCCNTLNNVPPQQYRISTKNNKVYDISERKLFCSNICFRACRFIKDQMHTSPLWLRDIEPPKNFTLMPCSLSSGGAGDEVNVFPERLRTEDFDLLKTNLHDVKENAKSSPESSINPTLSSYASHIDETLSKISYLDNIKPTLMEIHEEDNGTFEEPLDNGTFDLRSSSQKTDFMHCNVLSKSCIESCKLDRAQNSSEYSKEKPKVYDSDYEILQPHRHQLRGESDRNESTLKTQLQEGCNSSLPDFSTIILRSNTIPRDSKSRPLSNSDASLKNAIVDLGAVNKERQSESPGKIKDTEADVAVSIDSQNERVEAKSESSDQCQELYSNGSESLNFSPSSKILIDTLADCKDVSPSEMTVVVKSSKVSESKHKKGKGKAIITDIVSLIPNVEKSLKDWFTLETMCFLYGESALKIMLEEKGENIRTHYKALNSATWDSVKRERFLALCKRLSIVELEDYNFERQIKEEEVETKMRPLPDYNEIKKESETMELKVRAFYGGKMELKDKKVTFSEDTKTGDAVETERSIHVPLLDLHSQRALRKRIVLDGLNRVLPDFFRTFGLQSSEMVCSIRGLVSTFSLSPSNITFKPYEWSLVGLIILKLLSLREPVLRSSLQSEQSNTYLTLMLMSFNLEPGYLDRLILWLTDIDRLILKEQVNK